MNPDEHNIFTPLNLPMASLKLREGAKGVEVRDELRKKWLVMTPEEWVRQHFVGYLISDREVPATRIANEIAIELNGTSKRCDSVVFGPDLKPVAIVEYKAPQIEINQKVFDQILRYNLVLKVRHLIVSNGLVHVCCRIDTENHSYAFLREIPRYGDLL